MFCNVLLVCEQLGLLGGSHFSLDGVKLSANVSKEWSGTFEELKHKRDKLQEKLKQVMAEHLEADREPELAQERQKKRTKRLQLQLERLTEFLESEQPKLGRDGREIQSNAVDNESVKMPTSHGVVQGYNRARNSPFTRATNATAIAATTSTKPGPKIALSVRRGPGA